MSSFSRADILVRLGRERAAGRSILAVGAGNGLVANCAQQAGADLVVVYNSGYFRLNGYPSLLGNLPIGDANQIMLDLGRGIISPTRSLPVIGGIYGVDPTRDFNRLFDQMLDLGYSGVINFPTVGRVDGQYRRDLESAGLGLAREISQLNLAHRRGLFTMAYAYSPEDARAMVEAGVDVLVGHCGLTAGGDVGAANAVGLSEAADRLNAIFAAAQDVGRDVILLSHGGPIVTEQDAEWVNLQTGAAGFVAASSIERIPIEGSLKQACAAFKSIKTKSEQAKDPS